MSDGPALSMEELCIAVRVAIGVTTSGDVAALRTIVATPERLSLLIANRLGPLVARALQRDGGGQPLPTALTADARLAASGALGSRTPLADLASAFDSAGIQWMLWKGPALAVQAWNDDSLRHFADLDLVVGRADRHRAVSALLSAGWRPRHGMSLAQQRAIRRGSGAFDFERGDGEPFVELHWRFLSPRYPRVLRTEDVLARSETVAFGGLRIRTPAGADAVTLLALHATKHGWSQAEEVATLARLALRWPSAVSEARATLASAGTPLAAELASALRATLVSEESLGDSTHRSPLATAPAVLDSLDRMRRGEAAWRPDHAWILRWVARATDRARYLAEALLAPTLEEWKWVRLPGALAWTYPAVRLARLATR